MLLFTVARSEMALLNSLSSGFFLALLELLVAVGRRGLHSLITMELHCLGHESHH
jgi:hypothetical protein